MTVWRMRPFPALTTGSATGVGQGDLTQGYARTLFFCVAAITLVRLIGLMLSHTELFFDEAQYWFWSRELAFGYYSKPPLIAWIIRASTSVCGMSEACIRTPSPLIHAATAMVIYGIGRTLYDARTGFWAGIVYATLPGVSFSSAIISTDVPLLFFVAVALLALAKMRDEPSWRWAGVLGVALGFGLLSKYAMSYVLLGLGLYGVFTRPGRALFKTPHLYAALALGVAILSPNVIWNAANGFATLSHTADNAAWGRELFNTSAAADFILGQLGVFGPLLFAAFAYFAVMAVRRETGSGERILLFFSVPVVVLMIGQAFVSRAHANWAAFAYVGATVFVTAALLRGQWVRFFRISLGLHLGAGLALAFVGAIAWQTVLPGLGNPFARVQGWKAVAETTGLRAETGGFRAIATDWRPLAAELVYYLRDRNIPVVSLRHGTPRDHFELTRPLGDDTPRPILLVSFGGLNLPRPESHEEAASGINCVDGNGCASAPRGAEPIGSMELVQGRKRRTINFFAIRGNVE